MNQIKLDNNYYLYINDTSLKQITEIENIKLAKILKNKVLLLKIDFNKINPKSYKKLLKKLLNTKKRLSKTSVEIGKKENNQIILGYVLNYDENSKQQNDFIKGINAIFYKTKYERYNYIYDTVCDYLDGFFYGKNFCDFENNKCGEKRNTSSKIGCCRHYKYKFFGPILPTNKFIICEHLKEDYTCGAKCIGCKLYTCDYLKRKGIKFKIKDILLLDTFFNPLQKYFIKYMVFTPKDKVLKRLMIL